MDLNERFQSSKRSALTSADKHGALLQKSTALNLVPVFTYSVNSPQSPSELRPLKVTCWDLPTDEYFSDFNNLEKVTTATTDLPPDFRATPLLLVKQVDFTLLWEVWNISIRFVHIQSRYKDTGIPLYGRLLGFLDGNINCNRLSLISRHRTIEHHQINRDHHVDIMSESHCALWVYERAAVK